MWQIYFLSALFVQMSWATVASEHRIQGPKNFLSGYPAKNTEGSFNVVVEIPAGSNAKWEVDKTSGDLTWEFRKGKPRVVDFLPYPANYGMVPSTLLSKEAGGDGDPLDVIILGPAEPRGAVLKAKIIGGLKLLDRKEQDDKLLAIPERGLFAKIDSIEELQKKYPGALEILKLWFVNYKEKGKMELKGSLSKDEALKVAEQSIEAYKKATLNLPKRQKVRP